MALSPPQALRGFLVFAFLLLITSGILFLWLYGQVLERERDGLRLMAQTQSKQLETLLAQPNASTIPTESNTFGNGAIHRFINPEISLPSQPGTAIFALVTTQKDLADDQHPDIFDDHMTDSSIILHEKGPLHRKWLFIPDGTSQRYAQGQTMEVLAWYSKINHSPFGVLAFTPLHSLRSPFLVAGAITALLELGLFFWVGAGVLGFQTRSPQRDRLPDLPLPSILVDTREGIVICDDQGLIQSCNTRIEGMFLFRAPEIIGLDLARLLVPQRNPAEFMPYPGPDPLRNFRQTEQSPECLGRRKDGVIIPLTITLLDLPQRNRPSFLLVLRDVSEQKMAGRRLAAQNAVARILADSSTIQAATPEILRAMCESLGWQIGVLWEADPERNHLRCIETWCGIPGRFHEFLATTQGMTLSKGEGLPGQVWESGASLWVADAIKDLSHPRALMARQEGLHAGMAFPIKLGDVIHGVMEFYSWEIQEPDEDLLHQLHSVGSQIGQFMERKQIEGAFREREEHTRLILDTALDAVVTVNNQGNIIGWNKQAEKLFGWTSQEILGKSLEATIMPSQYRERYLQEFPRLVQSNDAPMLHKRFELVGKHRNNREIPLEISVSSIPTKTGIIVNGFLRDLTDRRNTEMALSKSEEQLRQAQKLEAIGTLAGGIAHDFNNILSAVVGYAEMAMQKIDPKHAALSPLQEVLRAGYRAKKLIHQIFTFSRQDDSGKKVMYLQPIVQEALNLLQPSFPSTITLKTDLHPHTSPVYADPTQIHQVVMNLGKNAEYAMRETGGQISVTVEEILVDARMASNIQELQMGRYIRLSLSDSGCGMPTQVQKRMFDPFFSTKKMGGGTGMGLSVIHGIVMSHGGAISVTSEKGIGTTFHIYFPVSQKPVAQRKVPRLPVTQGKKAKVMFVDDEVALTQWAKVLIQELGYSVEVFSDGIEAFEAFERNPEEFDILVTDQTMPTLTGDMLAQKVRGIKPQIPILLCSGYSHTMTQEKALEMGFQGFLSKPVLIDEMAQALEMALQQKFYHQPI